MPVSKQQNPAPVSPARLVFLAALTVLVALVVWVAVRAVGPSTADAAGPTVVLPSVSTVPVGAAEPQSPSPTISLLPPPSSSPTPTHSRSASPSTSAARHSASAPASSSPTPHVSHTSAKPPAPKATFSATVSSSSAWGGGYVGTVTVTNTGNKAGSWSLSVTHGSVSGLRLYTTWNAHGSQQGSTFSFSAGSLAPGQSASFGYEAGARTHTTLRPSGCSVASGSCRVS